MKKTIRLFLLTLATVVLTCCQNEMNDLVEESPQTSAQFEKDMEMIARLGFSTENVIDNDDYYLVEGDIAIMKGESYEIEPSVDSSDTPNLRQARTDYLLTVSNAADLKIMINPALGDSWRKATSAAIQHYNNILSNIQMREVTSNPDITIQYGNISSWGAGAFPTSDGKAGKTLFIQNSNEANSLTPEQKVFLVVHELGHTIGMRHTDYQTAPGEGAAINIPGTPGADMFSVFNSGYHYGGHVPSWLSFSKNDIKSIQTLYPIRISKSTESACIGERVTFTINNNKASIANIQWTAASGLKLISGQSSKSAIFEITANGNASAQAYIISGMYYYPTGSSGPADNATVSSTASIWVGIPPAPSFYSANGNTNGSTISPLQYMQFDISNPIFGSTYIWNGGKETSNTTFSVEAPRSGSLYVTVKSKNKCGCGPESSMWFDVRSSSSGGGGKDPEEPIGGF